MTTQPRDASSTGTTVGEYVLLTKIGEGGMGIVHLARRPDGERVALKLLRPHIVGDDEARARLAREVNSLSRIRSKWVAEILDADPWAPMPYVATRYVPGLPLHDHVVEDGPLSGSDLLWFAAGLAEGLASVHSVGVLHRDVKPSNVLMEGRTPILIDFGLARVADDPKLTHTGWLLGTPGYLAPEILYGDDASTASDVHSWAATVAYAATGHPPFGRGPAMAIMDRVRRGEHDLDRVESPLRDVLDAALAPEPGDRPTLDQLLDWLRPQTTRPGPVLKAAPGVGAAVVEDVFTMPMALAAQAREQASTEVVADDEVYDQYADDYDEYDGRYDVRDDVRDPAGAPSTLVMPTEVAPGAMRSPAVDHYPAQAPYLLPQPPNQPPAQPPNQYREQTYPEQYGPDPYGHLYQDAYQGAPPATAGEKLRRMLLVGSGAVLAGLGIAAAPWVVVALLAVAVWILRAGSQTASAVAAKRMLRGRKWHDAPHFVLRSPWHLLTSLAGTVMLLLWSAGLAAATGLICYAVAAPLTPSLFLAGFTFALSLWWGPGGARVRSPINRLAHPVSASGGNWVLTVVGIGLACVACGALLVTQGTNWWPGTEQPLSSLNTAELNPLR